MTGHYFQTPFVFDNFVHLKGLGSKEKIKLTFQRLFDNPFSKYLTFFLSAVAVLGNLAKLKRDLGLAFGARFLHDFSIKMFLI